MNTHHMNHQDIYGESLITAQSVDPRMYDNGKLRRITHMHVMDVYL